MPDSNTKILLHLGFPKTGTTTLQNGFFYQFYKENFNLNYLGITNKETDNRLHKLREKIKLWIKSSDEKNEKELLLFLKKYLKNGFNICSEEALLNSYQNPPKLFNPELVKNVFSKLSNDIQILILIRNQTEMIYSLYAHSGGKYANSKYNTSHKFIDYCINDIENNYYFKFYNVIKSYQKFFGEKNVHILFFEDLKYNSEYFFKQLAEVLQQPFDDIKNSLVKTHFWKKERSLDGSYYKVLKNSRKWHSFIKQSLFTEIIKKLLFKLNIYNNFKRLIKIDATFKYLIPKFTDQQNQIIKKHFYNNNLKLIKLLKCESEKLKKYNYL